MSVPGDRQFSTRTDKGLDLGGSDVLLQKLPVVVQQGGDRVLREDVIADLFLHEAEVLGYVLLEYCNKIIGVCRECLGYKVHHCILFMFEQKCKIIHFYLRIH